MLAVGGVGNGLMSASGQLLFQRRVPNDRLGRVLGAASALWRVAYAASFLLGGVTVALAGVRGVFALAGAGTLVALLPLLLLLVSRREPGPAESPAPGD
jgi:MFS family permease